MEERGAASVRENMIVGTQKSRDISFEAKPDKS